MYAFIFLIFKYPLKERPLRFGNKSSVKWSVLAHLKSQPRGQNFQAQKPVERSSPHQTRINKNAKNTFKIN